MRKLIKNNLLGFLLGIIISGGLSAFAVTSILGTNVFYIWIFNIVITLLARIGVGIGTAISLA